MGIDAGSVYSEVRIRLDKLDADIRSAGTAFDNLGEEFSRKADNYSNIAGKKYKTALSAIAKETQNVMEAAKAGALTEGQAIERLIALRKEELKILQDRAVKEGQASKETVAAIQKTQGALEQLEKQQKELDKTGTETGGSIMSTFRDMQSVMMGPFAALQTGIRIIRQAGQEVAALEAEWSKQAESSAKLGAVYKSVGAEAWTTYGHLKALAGGLAETTKYADEEIESMEAVLLGFRKIQGVNFDKAVASALDMAQVMGLDLTNAAQSIGKALDDPIAGLDSLQRQGFRWTEQEKEMLKQMVETGNIAKAQGIILSELAKTFGGAAEAVAKTSGAMKEMKDKAIGELKEEMGRAISGSGFMVAWRTAIKNIADEWAAALKAHNDYRDAVAKEKRGEALTTAETLLKAQGDLEGLIQSVDATYNGITPTWLEPEIKAIEQLITRLKAQALAEQRLAAATTKEKEAAAKADVERTAAETKRAEREKEFAKSRSEAVGQYNKKLAETLMLENKGVISAEEATNRRVDAAKGAAEALARVAVEFPDLWGNANESTWLTPILNDLAAFNAAAEAARITAVDSKRMEAAARGYLRISQEQTEQQEKLMKIEGARMEAAARGYLRVAYSAEEAARITAEVENKSLQQRIAAQHAQVNAARAALEEIKKATTEAEATRIMLVDSQRLEAAARGYLRIAHQAQELALEAEEAERRAAAERAGRQHLELQEAIRSFNEQKEAEQWRIMLVDAERLEAAARGYVRIAYQAEETEKAIAEAEQKAMLDRVARQHLELNAARRAQEEAKTKAAEEETKRLMLIDAQRWEAASRGYLRYENEVRVAMEKAAERTAEEERNRQGQIAGERYTRQFQAWDEANRLSTLATEEAMARWKQSRADDLADAKQYYNSLVDIYQNLFESIKLETDEEKKAFLNSLLAKVNAAQATGATIQEINFMMTEESMKFSLGKQIDESYKSITYNAEASFKTQISGWESLKILFKDDEDRLKKIEEIINKLKKSRVEEAIEDTVKTSLSAIQQIASALESLFTAQADAAIDAIEQRLEDLKKSYGANASELRTMYEALKDMGDKEAASNVKAQLKKQEALEEYASLSEETLAQLYLKAIENGKTETAALIAQAQARVAAEENAEKEIANIQYEAELASWQFKKVSAIASTAQAAIDAYASTIKIPLVGTVLAPIAAAAAIAAGGIQLAAIDKAKPQKPKLETGGLVLPAKSAGTDVTVAERGNGEILFGTGALGEPLMQGFAELVASQVAGLVLKQPIVIQQILDGRVLAESTVKLIDDGQVRFKRLKVGRS